METVTPVPLSLDIYDKDAISNKLSYVLKVQDIVEGVRSSVEVSLILLGITKPRSPETSLWLRLSDGYHAMFVNPQDVRLAIGNASHVFCT